MRPVSPAARPAQRPPYQAAPPQSRPPQRPPMRPAQPPRRPSGRTIEAPFEAHRDMQPVWITLAALIAIFALGCLLQYAIYPGGYFPAASANKTEVVAEFSSSRGVCISEVMTANKTAISDADGNSPDWIELMNVSSSPVDITGWALLDKASRSTYFVFPEYTLESGEAVIVFASGHLQNENGADFHAPFRLGSTGDTLMLSDAHGVVVESINIPALGSNQSYARMDGNWTITSEYTPGMENTRLNYASLTSTQPQANATLVISEVMASNASFHAPEGGLYDWIEVQNTGSSAINLEGYSLSDSSDKPAQWKFPAVVLQPGQCVVVYASGLSTTQDSALHAPFGLRAEGESIWLYNSNGQVIDLIEFDNLKTDQSLKRQLDGSYSTSGTPSPGQAN